ncbi:colony stimulating factor 3 (granulocyte) a [Thalassophryne amazonica]|uniref:colony stimulating factor 3 (granulocyte) a n=1 Tax=Thalassophryne amazonica TaxID=390379 RepID=UPI001471C0B3|nr:colony stimulating factor 3 (granulocyte) a [Thalassophryne amazonica]
MNLYCVFCLPDVLLHCCVFAVLVQSAPVDPQLAFREAAERAKLLVEKILHDIPTAYRATVTMEGLTLDPSNQPANLQMMTTSLKIPAAPVLKPLSDSFTLDTCVKRMSAGSRLHHDLLGSLAGQLNGLNDLRADLWDLLSQISNLKQLADLSDPTEHYQRPDLTSTLQSDYDVQMAAHLILKQLRSFCHDLIRSLRAISSIRPSAAATR